MSSVETQVETPPTRTSALNTAKNEHGQVKRLHHIPRPTSKIAERTWVLGQMAAAFRIFAKLGFADGSSGHISLRGTVDEGKVPVLASVLTASRPCRATYLLDQPLCHALCLAKGLRYGSCR
jgi:hypothetical protein